MDRFSKQQIVNTISFWQKFLNESTESVELIDGYSIITYLDKDKIDLLLKTVIDLVVKTYEPIGGYYGNTNINRLKRTTSMIKAVYDSNNDMIACSFYRNVDNSHKLQAYGNNQTYDGKNATKAIIHSDVNQYEKWIWGEVSMMVEYYFKKYNGYPLPNDFVVEALEKNQSEIQLSQDGFHYKRKIGQNTDPDEKVVFGFKNKKIFDKVMQYADYELLRKEFNLNLIGESENENFDFKIKSFKGACSFVNQLSDLYDEKNFRQLTPGLVSLLEQSIEILKTNINLYPWVSRTLDNAEYLRDNTDRIVLMPNRL